MNILSECVPCLLRQAGDAAKRTTDDLTVYERVRAEAEELLAHYECFPNSPALAYEIHAAVKRLVGSNDPYAAIKQKDLSAALSIYPLLKDFMKIHDNALEWALKVAATGNNLDAAIYGDTDLRACVEKELGLALARSDAAVIAERLANARRVLVIGDNTGESVFDRVMLESLSTNAELYYAVRSEPIINDVTRADAIASGLDRVATVVESGSCIPGIELEACNERFLELFWGADLVISKGQGNYETLSDVPREIFFLLKAKCPAIAKLLDVPLGSYICMRSEAKETV